MVSQEKLSYKYSSCHVYVQLEDFLRLHPQIHYDRINDAVYLADPYWQSEQPSGKPGVSLALSLRVSLLLIKIEGVNPKEWKSIGFVMYKWVRM